MESLAIVSRRDRLGDLAFYFHANMVGQHQVAARLPFRLGDGERRREGRRRRMREKSVNAVFGGGQVRIVVIVRVEGDTVEEGGEPRRRRNRGPDQGRFSGGAKGCDGGTACGSSFGGP